MATITEDYVSYEVAKLLKDKGFDQNCATYYLDGQVWRHYHGEVIPKDKQIYAAHTQAMVMRWLREVHKLHIEILASYHFRIFDGYSFEVYNIKDAEFVNYSSDKGTFKTYEEAAESSIKYCLEHLI